METLQAIAIRKSVRDFGPDQIPNDALDTILAAGCAAAVGHGERQEMHLTVVQDPQALAHIRHAAQECFGDPLRDIYYGAPTVVIISAGGLSVPELALANAGCIATNMMLAATDLGVGSVYVWGTVLAFREEPELAETVGLPDGFVPVASVALGHAARPDTGDAPAVRSIEMNRV